MEYEKLIEQVELGDGELNEVCVSYIFQKIDYRQRHLAFRACFDYVANYLLQHNNAINLVAFDSVNLEDSKRSRHLGFWNRLKVEHQIEIPLGNRLEYTAINPNGLRHIGIINLEKDSLSSVLDFLDKFRNSILVFGTLPTDQFFWDCFFDRSTNLQNSNAKSWLPVAAHLVGKDLSGVRLFGMFDDLENGVVVYEPIPFSKLHGDWNLRSLTSS